MKSAYKNCDKYRAIIRLAYCNMINYLNKFMLVRILYLICMVNCWSEMGQFWYFLWCIIHSSPWIVFIQSDFEWNVFRKCFFRWFKIIVSKNIMFFIISLFFGIIFCFRYSAAFLGTNYLMSWGLETVNIYLHIWKLIYW